LGHHAGPTKTFSSVKAIPDGRFFATIEDPNLTAKKKLKKIAFEPWTLIFDAATGKLLGKVPSWSIVFAADGKTLAAGEFEHDAICLYDLPSLKQRCSVPIKTVNGPGPPGTGKKSAGSGSMFFSPDSQLLAAPLDAGSLGIWDTTNGKQRGQVKATAPELHNGAFNGAFSPDGRTVALDNGNGTVGIWEIASGNLRSTMGSPLAALKDESPTRSYLYPYGLRSSTHTLAFSPDGTLLAFAGLDKTVHVWEVATGKAVAAFKGHTSVLLCVAFSPDGTRLASGSADTTALIWDLTKAKRPNN